MPFEPGHPKAPNSGRPKGSKNSKPTELRRDLYAALKEEGFDPVESLVWVHKAARKEYERAEEIFDAVNDERARKGLDLVTMSEAPAYLRIAESSAAHMWKFLFPQLKSQEFKGEAANKLADSFAELALRLAKK